MKNLIFILAFAPIFCFSQTPVYIDTVGVNKIRWNADIHDSLRVWPDYWGRGIYSGYTLVPWRIESQEVKRLSTRTVSTLVVQFNCGEEVGEILETFVHDGWTYSLSSTGWRKTKNL